jgi:hypothetical protein
LVFHIQWGIYSELYLRREWNRRRVMSLGDEVSITEKKIMWMLLSKEKVK